VRRGAVMLAVHVNDPAEIDALAIMDRHGARNLRDEFDTWKASGWHGPAADPHPYVFESTIKSHEMPEAEE
jgi:hypothetical protein